MASSIGSASVQTTLFRNNHNVPLKCFIQFDSSPEQVAEVKSLLEAHGADVSTYLQHALVILVDPPTSGGQLLIREFGNDANRAILDFGWVRKCVQQGRCIGPSENWGGHRLPVTNVNEFFSYAQPPPTPVPVSPTYSRSIGPYPHVPPSQFESQPSGGPLPSPAISHALPPSPILTQRDRSESKMDYSFEGSKASLGSRGRTSSSTSDRISEPEPPGPSAKVLHHNGMGAKFTDTDNNYIREYFKWSRRYFPNRTQRQVVDKISEKMPYHSAVSVVQYMRRNPHLFGEPRRSDASNIKVEQSLPTVSRPREPIHDDTYDPGHTDDEEAPKPPTNLVPFAKGYRFTSADDVFIVAYFKWYHKRHPEAGRMEVLRELASTATYRSLPSWTTHFHKFAAEFRRKIHWLRDEISDEEEETVSPEPEADIRNEASLERVDDPEIDSADARRWNPPRKTSLSKSVPVIPGVEEPDADYDDRDRPSRTRPHSPRMPRVQPAAAPEPVKRRPGRPENTRRRSVAFTAEERRIFIEFLADHPWVWTTVSPPKDWVQGATTASAVWQKFEKQNPHRSDASWREYHKRNAAEFDAEAKALRQARAAGRAPPSVQPIDPESDQDPVDGEDYDEDLDLDDVADDDDDDYPEDQNNLPASSFSYAPIPLAEDSEDEDQLHTDDEDEKMIIKAPVGRDAAAPKGSSRKGRAYIPFTQEQRDRFMEFLQDNPQVWIGAPAEPGWISTEQSTKGKDSTWRQLANMPGMQNHSYKSWREFHRSRARELDQTARAKRLARESSTQQASTATIPPLAVPSRPESSMLAPEIAVKRAHESDSDMDMSSTPPSPKRSKIEDEDILSLS